MPSLIILALSITLFHIDIDEGPLPPLATPHCHCHWLMLSLLASHYAIDTAIALPLRATLITVIFSATFIDGWPQLMPFSAYCWAGHCHESFFRIATHDFLHFFRHNITLLLRHIVFVIFDAASWYWYDLYNITITPCSWYWYDADIFFIAIASHTAITVTDYYCYVDTPLLYWYWILHSHAINIFTATNISLVYHYCYFRCFSLIAFIARRSLALIGFRYAICHYIRHYVFAAISCHWWLPLHTLCHTLLFMPLRLSLLSYWYWSRFHWYINIIYCWHDIAIFRHWFSSLRQLRCHWLHILPHWYWSLRRCHFSLFLHYCRCRHIDADWYFFIAATYTYYAFDYTHAIAAISWYW